MKAFSRFFIFLSFLLLYIPIIILIIFSFNESGSLAEFSGFSFEWYKELFNDAEALTALRNSLVLAVLSSVIATVIGTFGALGLYRMKSKYVKGSVTAVTNIPMMNPDIVTGVSMMLLFVAVAGIISSKSFFGFGTMLIAHVTFSLPYVLLSVMPRFRQLDKSLSEAAQDLGANPWQVFWKVQVPLSMPGVVSGIMMVFMPTVSTFAISEFLTNNKIKLFGTIIQENINSSMWNYGAALSLVMLVIIGITSLLQDNKKEESGAIV